MAADTVTIELIRNALISVTGEMRTKIMRSAFSPIIYESLDFSVAFFNERAETLAQADGLPYFLCDLPNAVRAVIEDVGGVEHMRAGDVFLVNDPYRCSQHPQDVSIVKPAYYRGEHFGFTAVRVHLIDLGGKAGFASTDATEIFQEGLVIPTVHLHSEGQLNEEIVRLMAANSRMSRSTMLGDRQAQVGACIVGEARLVEVIERYGFELYRECCDALLVQGEAYARAKVREIPDGRYVAEQMVKQGRGGVIVNVASTSGLSGRTDAIAYMAAKGGVVNLSRGMAVQLSQYNIRVNCLTPNRSGSPVGQDEGAEGREFKNLAGRLGTADDQAKAMLFLASDDSGFVWGENLICDGGVTAASNFPKERLPAN